MDRVDVNNACSVAGIPQAVIDQIWSVKRGFGEVY